MKLREYSIIKTLFFNFYYLPFKTALSFYEPVKIGDHVWIASNASVLKGSDIKSGTVVGYGSIISKSIEKDHVLLGGINKVLKDNIDWRK